MNGNGNEVLAISAELNQYLIWELLNQMPNILPGNNCCNLMLVAAWRRNIRYFANTAVSHQWYNVTPWLLRHRASVTHSDKNGISPFSLMAEMNYRRAVPLFEHQHVGDCLNFIVSKPENALVLLLSVMIRARLYQSSREQAFWSLV
jgi:hypothetical protein